MAEFAKGRLLGRGAEFLQDARRGLRLLARSPAATLVVVLTLAIGAGVNVAVFSMVNTVLLRALPFRDPDRLAIIYQANPRIPKFPASYPDYMDFKRQATAFQGMGAYTLRSQDNMVLVHGGEPVQIQAALISHDLFPLMGIRPEHGRGFLPWEEQPGQDQVVILSHRLWSQRFGSSAAIVGQQVEIAGKLFTVLGVMRKRDQFPEEADLWMPLSRLEAHDRASRGARRLWVVARRKPGVSEKQSLAALQSIMSRLSESYPEADTNVGVAQVNLLDYYTGNVQRTLAILLGAATLVLLIACANIANVVLGRAAGRRKETAIRAALGATRTRLFRQLLAESLVLAGLGTVCGLVMAAGACHLLRGWAAGSSPIPRLAETSVDATVLAYAFGIALLTGLAFGVWPAVKNSRADLSESLNEAGRTTQSPPGVRMRNALVAAEVGVAVIVLVSTTLLVRSLRGLRRVDPGFRTANILTVPLSLPAQRYPDARKTTEFYRQLLERTRSLPGVKSAATINIPHMAPSLGLMHFGVEGDPPVPMGQRPVAQVRTVSPGYFEMMGIPIRKGRGFWETDTWDNARPCFVINETLARMYFPDTDSTGRRLVVVEAPTPFAVPVIGVAADVRDLGLGKEPEPEIYGVGYSRDGILLVHTGADPLGLTGAIRREVRFLDPYQPLGPVTTMKEAIDNSLARNTLLAGLMTLFSGLALFLAVVGIYGVMAHAVAQRTPEIAIRMAVGADGSAIRGLLLREGLPPVAAGLAAGLTGAWSLRSGLSGFLFGISPSDATAYLTVSAGILTMAVTAILVSSRRAVRVDPQAALWRG